MAPIITDPKKLSMPQQVQKNKDDIAEIKVVIDGLDSLDNVIIVPDISHIMTAEELKSVKQPVCFIVYDNHIYIKKKEESGNAYFDIVFSIIATTVISFQSSEIEVNLSNGALGIVNSNVSTYSNTKVDELLALKTSYTYVDTELAKKASLTGANFTGAITAPSIVENMSSLYRFVPASITGFTITNVYCGAVKNGNKLTFVQFFKITRTGDTNYGTLGSFQLPADVAAKLYPTPLGVVDTALASQVISFFSDPQTCVDIKTITRKGTNSIENFGYGLTALTLNTEYQARIETTFLLSDPLNS